MFATLSFLSALLLSVVPTTLAADPISSNSLPYNFTLAALNTTLPNANTTGAPLVLGQNGATSGLSFQVSSTYASFPYNDWPTLALVDTSLRAFLSSGQWITNSTGAPSGGTLGWATSTVYTSAAVKGFTAIQNPGAQFAILAKDGISNLWSLCPFSGFRGQTNVIFNVSAAPAGSGFDPANCYAVNLNMVPV